MAKIIGIDLGTTNSCVAVMEGGKPKVIHSAEGENIIPSVVNPIKNIVGRVAKRQAVVNPKETIFSIKRLMGRKFKDPEVQRDIKWLPYTIKEGREGMAVVEVEGHDYTPQEISAQILQKIKADAESYLGEKVTDAVLRSRRILTMHSVKLPNKPAKLRAWMLKELLMSRLLLLWLMVWINLIRTPLLFTILGEALLIFLFWSWVTVYLKLNPPMGILIWAVMILTRLF